MVGRLLQLKRLHVWMAKVGAIGRWGCGCGRDCSAAALHTADTLVKTAYYMLHPSP